VLRQGLLVAGVGVLAGIPLAIALGRVLRSHFDSVGALQPGGLAAAAAIVATAAAIAALTPARRALAVDPMEVLRADA
jgi:ABC-type antimicrobial peptide transport system permease subunit